MTLLDIFFLAVALAMDCFAVSITCGIIEKRMVLKIVLLTALMFGFFQAVMPLLKAQIAAHTIDANRQNRCCCQKCMRHGKWFCIVHSFFQKKEAKKFQKTYKTYHKHINP